MTSNPVYLDHSGYLHHLAADSARFLAVLRDLPAGTPVPTCPDWDVDDLLWHLGEVQWFWGQVVRGRLCEYADVAQLASARPTDRAGLVEFAADAGRELCATLTDTPPQTPAWTWSAEQTAGFIRRRQAHEALIHRLDAELTAEVAPAAGAAGPDGLATGGGVRTPLDPALACDGVDEILRIMYQRVPVGATFTPDRATTLRLTATDTGASWLVELGRVTGSAPVTSQPYDRPGLRVAPDGSPEQGAATVTGLAADLDCWLWHRPPVTAPRLSGDRSVFDRFEQLVAKGVN